jgi:hypothetical protein
MLDNAIPVKTPAGRLEIGERRQKLGPRHRMVLISINGEHSVNDIRQQFRSVTEIDTLLDELFDAGLIELSGASTATMASVPAEPPPSTAPIAAEEAPSDSAALQTARQFMNKSVVAKLGLRAFMFTLRVEKCYSKQELLDLLPEYRRVLRKGVDAGGVAELSARAEQLIAEI